MGCEHRNKLVYLLDGGLLEGVVGHNGVLAAGVAGSAVGVEDLLTGTGVTGKGGGGHEEGGTGSGHLGGVGLGRHLDGGLQAAATELKRFCSDISAAHS